MVKRKSKPSDRRAREEWHPSGTVVGGIAGGLAVGLLGIGRLATEFEWGFVPAHVGNAGEWFSGIAGAAVLAWTVGEPSRARSRDEAQRLIRKQRREAWQSLYVALAPFDSDEHPYQLSQAANAATTAQQQGAFIRWRDGGGRAAGEPKPERAAQGLELARSLSELPHRLRSHGPSVTDALTALVDDYAVDQLSLPLDLVRRLIFAANDEQNWWPHEDAQAVIDRAVAETTTEPSWAMLAGWDCLEALRDLAARVRREPSDAAFDPTVELRRTRARPGTELAVTEAFVDLGDILDASGF